MNLEQKMKDRNRENSYRSAGVCLFFILMIAGFVLGTTLIFLRPEKSDLEKRELTKFPKFTLESFLSGAYTSAIETWYADTFPFRETLLKSEQQLKLMHGFQSDAINNIGDADDGPNFDDMIASLSPKESDTEAEKSSAPEEPGSSSEERPEGSSENPGESSGEPDTVPPETEEPVETRDPAEIANEGRDIAVMNPQEAGNVNVKDLVGYCVYGFNIKAADKYCENVAEVAEGLKGIAKVYDILIPDNAAIKLDEDTKKAWKLLDERKVIEYYNAKIRSLTAESIEIGIYDILEEHHDEYLYFKTDHHWTQLGAYYAYAEFCKAADLQAYEIDSYDQEVTPDFLGSYYSTNGYTQLKDNPDTVIAYKPHTVEWFRFFDTAQGVYREGRIIRNMSEFDPTFKYLGFIYGDNPISIIENKTVENGRKCIVIKESFGNAWVPFLADHFEKVIVIDYRTYKESVIDLAKEEGVTDVVFINNLEAISDKQVMDVLGNICR